MPPTCEICGLMRSECHCNWTAFGPVIERAYNTGYGKGRVEAFEEAADLAAREGDKSAKLGDLSFAGGCNHVYGLLKARVTFIEHNCRAPLSGAGAAGVQEPAKKPADTGPAPDIAADREALGQILGLGTLSPGQWVELKKLCRDMVAAAREHGRREGRLAALTVAAADIRLLASEGWVPAAGEAPKAGSQLLEMAARRIESIARGENLCSICRRYHGKEITHACE